jgi:hypothetical protein
MLLLELSMSTRILSAHQAAGPAKEFALSTVECSSSVTIGFFDFAQKSS